MPATFTKGERLSSYKEIQSLMKGGKTFFHYPFKIVYSFPGTETLQSLSSGERSSAIIVSVPKRNFKRAVKRNLLKRRIRESYRLNKMLLSAPQGCVAHILFVYISKDIMEFSHIEKRMKEALQHISLQSTDKKGAENETEKI